MANKGSLPGNSQGLGLASDQYCRNSSKSRGERSACRSFLPLPCSTRSNMRSLSISETSGVCDLGHAQAGTIGHTECCLVLDTRCCLEKLRHLLFAEHDAQLLRHRDADQVVTHVRAVQRYPEEEPQGSDRAVDGAWWLTGAALMHLIAA